MVRMTRMFVAIVAALIFVASTYAVGGNYTVIGTPEQEGVVRGALDISRYDWSRVPHVTIRIVPELVNEAEAVPGEIRVRADILNYGRASWGTIQHEYAHQVDFFLMTDAMRVEAMRFFGLSVWHDPTLPHDRQAAELFASTLAWVYWPSVKNLMRRETRGDPRAFQAMLARWGLADPPPPICVRVKITTHRQMEL